MNDNAAGKRPELRLPSLSLRWKMLVGFGLLVAATLSATSLVRTFGIPFTDYRGSYSEHQSAVFTNLGMVADLKKEHFLLWLEERMSDVRVLAGSGFVESTAQALTRKTRDYTPKTGLMPDLRSELLTDADQKALTQHLKTIVSLQRTYARIRVIGSRTGTVISSTDESEIGSVVAETMHFSAALNSENGLACVMEKSTATDKPYLMISALVETPSPENSKRTDCAVITAYVDTDEFIKPMLLTGGGLGESGEVNLVDQDGTVLTSLKHPLKDGSVAKPLKNRVNSEPEVLAAGGTEGIVAAKDYRGVPVLAAYRFLKLGPGLGWGMVVKRDQNEVFAPLWRRIVYSSLVGLVGLLLGGVLAVLIANKISRPILALIGAAREVESGNLDARAHVSGSGEAAALAATFNSMIERIKNWHEDLEEQVKARTALFNESNRKLTAEICEHRLSQERLRKSNRALKTLSECNEALIRAKDEFQLNSAICRVIVEVGGYAMTWVGYTDSDASKTVRPVAHYGLDDGFLAQLKITWDETESGRGPTGTAVRTGSPSVVHHIPTDPNYGPWRDEVVSRGYLSSVALPLMADEGCIGVLKIYAPQPEAFNEAELALLLELANDLSFGIMALRAKEKLRASEAKYRELVENANSIILRTDVTGHIKFLNEFGLKFFGYSEEEIIGRHLMGTLLANTDSLRHDLASVARDIIDHPEQRAILDYEHTRKNGEQAWVSWMNRAISPEAGGPIEILSVGIESTARKRAEEALRFEREQLLSIFDGINQLILVLDPHTYEILYANKYCRDVYGTELIGQPCYRFKGCGSPCEECPNLKIIAQQGTPLEREIHEPLLQRDFLQTQRMIRWPDGRTVKFVFAVDITERKKAEELSRLLSEVVQQTTEGIAVCDLNGCISFVNKAFAEMHGYTPEEVVGRHLSLFHTPNQMPFVEPTLVQIMETGEFTGEQWHAHRGGETFPTWMHNTLLRDAQGTPTGMIATCHDIISMKRTEAALRESREMLDLILSASPVGIAWIHDGKIRWMNDSMVKIFGLDRKEDYLGKAADIVYVSNEEYRRVGQALYRSLQEGGVAEADSVLRRKDGSLFHGQIRVNSPDTSVPIENSVVVVTDITWRKKAEEDLKKSEALFRKILETMPVGVWITDANGRITHGNPASEKIWGGARFVDRDQYGEYKAWWADTGKPIRPYEWAAARAVTKGEISLDEVIDIQSFDGAWKTILNSAVPIRDDRDEILGAIVVNQDITDRLRAEKALAASEKQLRLLIEASPIGIRIVQRGVHVFVNPALVKTFGYEGSEEIVGLPVEALYVPEHRDMVKKRSQHIRIGQVPDSFYEARGLRKNGESFDMAIWVTVIDYMGDHASLAFVTDVSEAKILRSQLIQAQKMEAIGTLAGGLAHDFNNLLTITSGYAELLLLDKDEGDPGYKALQRIAQASQRGGDLVQRLLTFSRKVESNFRPTNLNRSVRTVVKLLSRTIPKMIAIRLDLTEDLNTIRADSGQIEQLLMNLAVNSRHAMPDGGKLLFATQNIVLDEAYCKRHLGTKPGSYALLTVEDTGHGMDRQTLDHIFEPFFTTKGPGEGTGLGLAMVYGIVQSHSGHITCESTEREGTSFRIYLPVVEAESEMPRSKRKLSMPAGGTETILLVDDDPIIREVGSQILEQAGYSVLTATNGRDALRIYRKEKNRISLTIMDLIMPQMGGRQCMEKILEINPEAKILIATGVAADAQTKEALERGAKGLVSKPYEIGQVLQLVRDILDS